MGTFDGATAGVPSGMAIGKIVCWRVVGTAAFPETGSNSRTAMVMIGTSDSFIAVLLFIAGLLCVKKNRMLDRLIAVFLLKKSLLMKPLWGIAMACQGYTLLYTPA